VGEILFLAHRIPYPPDKGDKIRSWNMLKWLTGRERVHLGAFVDDPADMAHEAFLRGICASVNLIPVRAAAKPWRALKGFATGQPLSVALLHDAAMTAWVRATLAANPVDALFAFSGQMAPYILPHTAGRRSVMDLVDLDSEKWAQYAAEDRGPRGIVYAREARRLLAFEAEVAAKVDATLFVSEDEAALFRARAEVAGEHVHALSNGVDFDYFSPDAEFARAPIEGHDLAGPLIVFVGAMDYRPNIDAARWFVAQVWPRVREARPEARFLVVGSKPGPETLALGTARGVTVTGRVVDVRPYIAAADVVVAPLRIARGIQNKVLEAMAMARPVLATPQAREGIDAEPGRDLLIEADAPAFATACLALLANPARAAAIGHAARARMEVAYTWDANLRLLGRLLLSDAGASAAREAA